MKTNQKTLRLPQWIVAAVAVLALIAGAVLLFYFSQVSLLLVFAPAVVALVGGAVLVIVNRKFFDLAGVLALVGTAVYGYTVSEQAFANVQGLAYVPLLVFFAVFLLLRDTAATKESFRKFLVSLKRNPQYIPLVMLFITFLVYTLNLTDVSDTTAKILGRGMGLSQFCIMLFSLLSMVCMLNAFPRRKKANIPMVVLMFIMFGIIIFCDIHYQNAVYAAITRTENPVVQTEYIQKAYDMLGIHMVLIIVTAALVVLLPVYRKLFKKINTSVAVEYGDDMAEIEINE